mmetsp:Transcript_18069/g.32117  ORF Transcript_18069/g.32117 Transcript_18069/m.32117 type:complete len:119 (-) Transcript_18069:42-398(-)
MFELPTYAYWTLANSYLESHFRKQAYTVEDLKAAFTKNFLLLYLYDSIFWMPVHFIFTFRHVSLAWQVPFASLLNIFFISGYSWIMHRPDGAVHSLVAPEQEPKSPCRSPRSPRGFTR